MKQFLLKLATGPGKKLVIFLMLGACAYYGVSTDLVKDFLNSPTVVRPAPVFMEADAGK